MQATRHALGALLLEQGHVAEAEQVYRADLGLDNTLLRGLPHRNNLPRLHGYVECLTLQGKHAEAATAQAQLNLAQAHADVEAGRHARVDLLLLPDPSFPLFISNQDNFLSRLHYLGDFW